MATNNIQQNTFIPAIGALPAGWGCTRVHNLFTEIVDRYDSKKDPSLPLLSVSEYYGVAERAEKIDEGEILIRASSLDGYKKCHTGDLVSNIMLTWRGALGVSPKDGIVSPAYCVYRPVSGVCGKYYHYLFRTQRYADIFKIHSTGLIDSRLRLYSAKFFAIKVPFPPLNEQEKIAKFLNEQCNKIDYICKEDQSSIHEYKSWKSSIINEGVIKGLKPNGEMKDSGIEWIGKIPNHWDATKIGNFVSIRSGITLGKRYTSEKVLVARPYLRVANVKADRLALDNVATIMVTPEEAKKYELVPGELLMTEGGDRDKLGRGTIWNGEIPGCLHQNHVFAVHVNEKYMLTKYLDYLTTSPVGREYFDLTAKKTTNLASTNSSTILRFTVPVPPISEQRDIVAMLDAKCKILDEIIQEKEALVRDLESYKKSLIYEVVTGKRKVV